MTWCAYDGGESQLPGNECPKLRAEKEKGRPEMSQKTMLLDDL